MNQSTGANNWVKVPKYPQWGFDAARPELLKIGIDLNPKRQQPTYGSAPKHDCSGDMSGRLLQYQQTHNRQTGENLPSGSFVPGLFREENRPSGLLNPENIQLFDAKHDEGATAHSFGGLILVKPTLRWRPRFYTRACGDVVGATESELPVPFNMSQVVRSVAVMRSNTKTQSAVWIGPRLLLSALHFHDWFQRDPTRGECQAVLESNQTFTVESEICSQILSQHSLKVRLVSFDTENYVGIFMLDEKYAPRSEWVQLDWLIERDQMYEKGLDAGRKVACIGYNARVSEGDEKKIREETWIQTQRILHQSAFSVEALDLDDVIKPQMRSCAPGTLDWASASNGKTSLGVSCSLWKGSGGSPCIMLDGIEGGSVIGLVRGYDCISAPYNLVNGLPVGLKDEIKRLSGF